MRSLLGLVASTIALLESISEKIFKKPKPENMVYLLDFNLFAGILCAVVFTVVGVLPPIFSGDNKIWFISVCLFGFALMGVALVIAYFNCRITFRDHDFTYKNFFGVKKTVQYRDLTGISKGNSDVKLYAGDKVIFVAGDAVNSERFLALAKKRYRESHNGKMIPKTTKKDIFNNHVEDPQSFILVFVMLAVFFPLMTVGVISFAGPESREDFSERFITVESYETSEGDLYIYDARGIEYCVDNYSKVIADSSKLKSKLSRGTRLGLLIKPIDSDGVRYLVSSIEMNGRSYLTFDKWHENRVQNFIFVTAILVAFNLMIFFFIGAMIYVGRNPHKFSDRVLHLFFRPGTIHRD